MEMFTLVGDRGRDKDQNLLLPIVLVPFPVAVLFPVLVPVQCDYTIIDQTTSDSYQYY